jgi:hypothetical protein
VTAALRGQSVQEDRAFKETSMKRTILAALFLGATTTMAAGQAATTTVVTDAETGQPVTVVYDKALSEEFEVNREIVDRVKEKFGESAVYDNGQDLPAGLDAALVPGNTLPEGIAGEVPAELGDLPTLGEGTHWVAAGEHLVEVTPENTIVMVVYDALP